MKKKSEVRKKLGIHLSKELRQKYGTRGVGVRKGDKVKIMKGKFKNQSGKIERIDSDKSRVFIDKVKVKKADGSERFFPISVSNLMATDIELSDQRRKMIFERRGKKSVKKLKEGK
jgi:large subunit ribosomal protein L24